MSGAPRILLVEDSLADARMLDFAFLEADDAPEIHHLVRGDTLLEDLRRVEPRLLILDLSLPGVRGDELLRRVRADDAASETCVVILTGSPDPDEERRCCEIGVEGFYVKPSTPEGYVALGRTLLDRHLR